METSLGELADNGRSSWTQTLAATGPFLILASVPFLPDLLVSLGLFDAPIPELTYWITLIATILALLVGFVVGWAKGWPRWSFPYTVLVIVALGVTVGVNWNVDYSSVPWFSFKARLAAGILIVGGVPVLLGRLWRPKQPLHESTRRDWTRLSFGLYGTVPLAIFLTFDEVPPGHSALWIVGACLIVIAGAVAYMRSTTKLRRVLALLVCVTMAMTVAGIGRATYWDGLPLEGMRRPGSWVQETRATVVGWTWLMAIIVAPALLGLLPRSEESVAAG